MDGDLSLNFQHCRATRAQMNAQANAQVNKGFFPLPTGNNLSDSRELSSKSSGHRQWPLNGWEPCRVKCDRID
jgi:hypothetical protein